MTLRMSKDEGSSIEIPWSQIGVVLVVVAKLWVVGKLTHILLRVILIRQIFLFSKLVLLFAYLVEVGLIVKTDVFIVFFAIVPRIFINLFWIFFPFVVRVLRSRSKSAATWPTSLRLRPGASWFSDWNFLFFKIYDFVVRILFFLLKFTHFFELVFERFIFIPLALNQLTFKTFVVHFS